MYTQEIFLKTNRKRLFERATILYERRHTAGLKSQFSAQLGWYNTRPMRLALRIMYFLMLGEMIKDTLLVCDISLFFFIYSKLIFYLVHAFTVNLYMFRLSHQSHHQA